MLLGLFVFIHLYSIPQNHLNILSFSDVEKLKYASFRLPSRSYSRRVVLITAASHTAFPYVLNLRCTLRNNTGLELMLFALDDATADLASKSKVPFIRLAEGVEDKTKPRPTSGNMHNYASQGFNYISKMKFIAVRNTLLAGFDVLFSDVDVVFCGDVPGVLAKELELNSPAPDILMQSNGFENGKKAHMNTGFYYVQSNRGTLDLFRGVIEYGSQEKYRDRNDQLVFDDFVCAADRGNGQFSVGKVGNQERGYCRWNKVSVRALDLYHFEHGGRVVHGVGKKCRSKSILTWHNNFSLASEKKSRFIGQKLWIIDEEKLTCRVQS